MTKKQYNFINGLFVLLGVVLLFEVIRDSVADGDFIGYLNAGNLVLAKKDIYSDYYNTWPPFFSVFSVILALIDKCSPVLVRVLWLTGSLVALFYIIKITSKMFLDKVPGFKNGASIRFQDPIIFVPVLIMVRFLLDNLDNVQINIYMLLLSCLTIYFFTQNKYLLSGLILALGISLKAYPIFILFYFIYKREMRVVLWTGIFLVLVNSITILVFGADQAFAYYHHFYSQIASIPPTAHNKNQSFLAMLLRLFTSTGTGSIQINFMNLSAEVVKRINYVVIAVLFLYPAYMFRKKLVNKTGIEAILEYSILLSVIPILSPLAWKAYFIFQWFSYFTVFVLLFKVPNEMGKNKMQFLKVLFTLSILLNIFTTDGVVGMYFSQILQTLSCITIGTMLIVLIQIILYKNISKFDLTAIKYARFDGVDLIHNSNGAKKK